MSAHSTHIAPNQNATDSNTNNTPASVVTTDSSKATQNNKTQNNNEHKAIATNCSIRTIGWIVCGIIIVCYVGQVICISIVWDKWQTPFLFYDDDDYDDCNQILNDYDYYVEDDTASIFILYGLDVIFGVFVFSLPNCVSSIMESINKQLILSVLFFMLQLVMVIVTTSYNANINQLYDALPELIYYGCVTWLDEDDDGNEVTYEDVLDSRESMADAMGWCTFFAWILFIVACIVTGYVVWKRYLEYKDDKNEQDSNTKDKNDNYGDAVNENVKPNNLARKTSMNEEIATNIVK